MKQASGKHIALILALALGLLSGCSTAEKPPQTITVTGAGQVNGQPDIQLVTLGFWVKDEDPNTAILNSKSRLAEMSVRLAALGIDPKDIRSFGANVNSEQIMGPDGFPTDRLLYAVNQNVNVTVRDPVNVGNVLNIIQTVAGAPYLYGVTVIDDLSESQRVQVLAEAHRKAVEDAQANAQQLAQSLGLTLGLPVGASTISQQVAASPTLRANVTIQISYEVQ